jgi:RNA polymerase sigma-70 factor (ECF subfamily)
MSFEDIYKQYWQKVFRLCMGYVNDYNWAKDIAQDTFVTVWQQLPKFRNESSVGTWIYRIASNNCLRQVEREKRISKSELPHEMHEEIGPDHDAQIVLLYKYIAELAEMDRIIISLELEDMKQAEIASIVGISESNVRVRIHRIKEKLIQKMSRHEPEYRY